MRVVLLLSLVVTITASYKLDLNAPLESDDIIQAVNDAKTTWKASRNFDPSFTKGYIKNLLGLKRHLRDRKPARAFPPPVQEDDQNLELPKTFDSRAKWSSCIGLQGVRDQGACGSGWAVAAATVFTDRLCIATKTRFNDQLSVQDLLTCCSDCGYGCGGGFDDDAWDYLLNTGICTGGDFKSEIGCQPYTVDQCEHFVHGPRKNCSAYGDVPTPACVDSCFNKEYKKHTKDKDLHKVTSVFSISNDINKMQMELYKNGPIHGAFDVYEDFLSYKSGVYQYTAGSFVSNHAVKLIGWGTENGTDYWLVANSWNSDWGDGGFFKIKKGTDECGIESGIYGGYVV